MSASCLGAELAGRTSSADRRVDITKPAPRDSTGTGRSRVGIASRVPVDDLAGLGISQ
jgi:hypothetical protein